MVQIVVGRNSEERDRFWKGYRACVEENRVRPDRSLFYVKWVQSFADFLPGKRLQDRSGKDIQAFPADLAQHINENLVQKAVKEATSRAGINKKVSCHTLRSFVCYASA